MIGREREWIIHPEDCYVAGAQLRPIQYSGPAGEVWKDATGECADQESIFIPLPMWAADDFAPDALRTIPTVVIQIACQPE